jgi:hypothetical protein
VDLDGDGHHDILSGSYSRMDESMAGLFQVLRGQADGSFRKAAELMGTDGQPLIIPADQENIVENICTRPSAVDWDGDGDLDLVVGNFAGSFYLFSGEGEGRFHPVPQKMAAGEGALAIEGHHSDPFPVDWDGDGDIDLVSGSARGGVQWAENTAASGEPPALAAFRTLIEPSPAAGYGRLLGEDDLIGPANATRAWVDDVNGDGKLDLLAGDMVTLAAPVHGLSEEEFNRRRAAWQAEYDRLSRQVESADGDQAGLERATARLQELYQEQTEFMTQERTGFVWLYLQK